MDEPADHNPQSPPVPEPPLGSRHGAVPPQRNGCLTALMVVIGVILLLPGLCALIFGADMLKASRPDPLFLTLVLTGLLVGAGGVLLIWVAIRRPRT
jgi:hypothetical protein